MTDRHLKIVADETPDGTTTSVGDDTSAAAPTLPGAAASPFDAQTELAVSMMGQALDAVEVAMFGSTPRQRRRGR